MTGDRVGGLPKEGPESAPLGRAFVARWERKLTGALDGLRFRWRAAVYADGAGSALCSRERQRRRPKGAALETVESDSIPFGPEPPHFAELVRICLPGERACGTE